MKDLTEQILGLQEGDHLCLIYDKDPAEQMPALIPFIKQGLQGGEQCIYIADDQTVDQVARALGSGGIDVDREMKQGALLLWTRAEWRQPGELDSEKKATQVRGFIDAAFAAGFKGIRFAVEMTWTLGPDISAARLKHWEATINKIFVPGFPGRIVCQYSRSRLAPAVVESSLSTHPLAIIGPTVHSNPYYEAPLLLSSPSEAGKLEWMLSQLEKGHQRATRHASERDRKLQQIHQLNDQVNRAEDLEEIYKASLSMILQSVRADRAAILLYDDDQVMRFKAWEGLSEEYRRAVEGHSPWRPDTPDPQPVCIPNVDHAPLDAPLREVVRGEGIRALAFFPLVHQKRLLGKFMVYYNTPHPFLQDEVQLVQTIAGHVAFSLQSKRREEELRQSQARLNIALEAGRMGAWEWEIPSGRLAWTLGLEEIHGLQPGTFGGRFEDFKRYIHPEDWESISEAIDRTLRERSEYRAEYRIVRPDGGAVWLESRGRLFLDPTGRPERMIGVCMDVTERKELEMRLRRSEQDLTDFFENGVTALHWVGPDGTILWANKAEMELLGYRPDEYIGHPIAEFHVDQEVIADLLRRLHAGEKVENCEARMRCKDGSIKHVLIDSNVLWENGRFIHTRCFTRDITCRKQMEEELQQKTIEAQEASRVKSEFVSNVSHELRTPLNAILGYSDLISEQIYGPVSDEQKTALDGVARNARELLNLINNLLDLSKIESGNTDLAIEPVDLPTLFDDVLAGLKPLLDKKSLDFRYEKTDLPILQLDRDKIRRVLVNLLSNAIKFTAKGGVTVRMEDQPDLKRVELSIQDTGIGIKPEDLPKIFNAFHQVDGTATREFGGSGLGLTIVRQLVDLLKGEIRVESEFGTGSTFILSLPYRID